MTYFRIQFTGTKSWRAALSPVMGLFCHKFLYTQAHSKILKLNQGSYVFKLLKSAKIFIVFNLIVFHTGNCTSPDNSRGYWRGIRGLS